MANIRIKDLPADSAPKADDKVPIDLGTTRNTTVEEFVFAGRPTATKTEAEAGTDNKKAMTPLAVKQAIDAQTGMRYVPVTRRVDSGAGLSGGQELTGDVTLSLNSASVASLAKADSAVQSVNSKSGNSVTITPADVGAAPSSIVADVNANTAERHSHTNKAILDATTASFLATEKTKLSGIESGAQVNTVTSVAGKTGAVTLSAADASAAPDTLVPDINANTTARHTHSNKAILDATTASFLAAEKTKLAGIEAGAQVNTVASVAGKTGAVALVKADVGLGNVDNTSDVNKPISTATQGALDGKYNNPAGTTAQYIRGDGSLSTFPSIPQGTVTSVGLTFPTGLSASGSPVTSSGTIAVSYATGYQGYTSAEASKLSGIAAGAQVNTVNSVNTKTGAVVLNASDVGAATSSQGAKADTAIQAPGGTTGQILAKNSNTSNDVAWVSSEAATAVSYGPQTLNDAQKGQAISNIGAGVLAGFRNKIINGDFNVWRRAASQTSSGYGSDDRWANINSGSTKTHSRVEFGLGQTDVPGNPKFYSKTTFTAGSGNADYCQKIQSIEGVETLSGKKATLTFYARSPAASGLKLASRLFQEFGTGGSPSASVTIDPVLHTLTTLWQKFTRVIDVPSIAGKTIGSDNNDALGVSFWFDAGSNHNAASASIGHQSGVIDIAHVSLVEGDATAELDPFSPRHIQQELGLCNRYYHRNVLDWDGHSESGVTYSASFPVNMRTNPTATYTNSSSFNFSTSPTGVATANRVICYRVATGTGAASWVTTFTLDAEL